MPVESSLEGYQFSPTPIQFSLVSFESSLEPINFSPAPFESSPEPINFSLVSFESSLEAKQNMKIPIAFYWKANSKSENAALPSKRCSRYTLTYGKAASLKIVVRNAKLVITVSGEG